MRTRKRAFGVSAMVVALATAATLLPAAPASAWTRLAGKCEGVQVDRCLSIRQNSNGTVYARAAITDDQALSANYSVEIYWVSMNFTDPSGNGYVTVRPGSGGLETVDDVEATIAEPVRCGSTVTAEAAYRWVGPSSGSGELQIRTTVRC